MRGRSLQSRILLLVTLGIAVILGTVGTASWLTVVSSTDRLLHERLVLAQATADHLERALQLSLLRLGNAVGPELNLEDGLDAELHALQQASRDVVFGDGVFLLDAHGKLLTRWPPGSRPIAPDALSEVVAGAVAGRPGVSGVLEVGTSGRRVVVGLEPLKGEGAEVRAIVGGTIDLTGTQIDDLTRTTATDQTIDVLDAHGTVLASSDPDNLFVNRDHRSLVADLIARRAAVVQECHDCHEPGRRRTEILALTPLATIPWAVSIRQDKEDVLEPATRLRTTLLVLGAVLLLGAATVAWGSVMSVVRPIRLLTRRVRTIASGNLDVPVPPLGEDEIGELGRHIESMRERLRSSLAEIRRWNEQLEAEVARRTAELGARNRELELRNALADRLFQSLGPDGTAPFVVGWFKDVVGGTAGLLSLRGSVVHAEGLGPGEAERLVAGLEGPSEPQVRGTDWIVPLKSYGAAIGFLLVRTPHPSPADAPLLGSLAKIVAVAAENERLYSEVLEKEIGRGKLLHKVTQAQEEERKRMARELHDSTSQELAVLVMRLEALAAAHPDAAAAIGPSRDLAVAALEGVHRVIFHLRPSMLDDLGLPSALAWLVSTQFDKTPVAARCEVSGTERRLPPRLETSLFRLAQEAVANVVRHAEASNVVLMFTFGESGVELTVEDDGAGFDPSGFTTAAADGRGLGLLGMRERVELWGGTFEVDSAPDQGTRIHVTVPYPTSEAPDADSRPARR